MIAKTVTNEPPTTNNKQASRKCYKCYKSENALSPPQHRAKSTPLTQLRSNPPLLAESLLTPTNNPRPLAVYALDRLHPSLEARARMKHPSPLSKAPLGMLVILAAFAAPASAQLDLPPELRRQLKTPTTS